MFHTGTTKAGGHSLLCVANKRRVIIYEFTKIKGVSISLNFPPKGQCAYLWCAKIELFLRAEIIVFQSISQRKKTL